MLRSPFVGVHGPASRIHGRERERALRPWVYRRTRAPAQFPAGGYGPWWGAIVTGAFGLLQVKKILAVKTPKGKGSAGGAPSIGGAGGSGGTAPAAAPSFNIIGNSGVNQIAQTLGQQQPVQAYVVANQVTTQQALDRSIVQNASLGG